MHGTGIKTNGKIFEGYVEYNTYALYICIVNNNTLSSVVPAVER